jgi:hypothetical protein
VEIAALLDPANAELRSYLGRAYMEEARSKVAGDQFDLARRLDPASHPWYFDAFRQLREGEPWLPCTTANRPWPATPTARCCSGTLLDQDGPPAAPAWAPPTSRSASPPRPRPPP